MSDKQKVGFVGLGTIGRPMATNIVKKGFPLAVFDLNQAAMASLIEPGFFTRLSLKDERLALTLAKEMGVDTPVGRGVYEALETACNAGHATKDYASVLLVREAEAGIEVRLADDKAS